MKAFVISEYAHHSKIPLTLDAPDPILEKESDNLLIDVYSAGLNFFDVCLSSLLYPPLTNLLSDPPSTRPLSNAAPTSIHSRHRVRRNSSGRASREPIQAGRPGVWERAGLLG